MIQNIEHITIKKQQANRLIAWLTALKNKTNNGMEAEIQKDIQSLQDKVKGASYDKAESS